MVKGEDIECFRCSAPRWIHGRSDWFCKGFVDPNCIEAVYDEWGVEIKPPGRQGKGKVVDEDEPPTRLC